MKNLVKIIKGVMMNNSIKVLAVDDEPTNQFIIEELLDGLYDVHLVDSGQKCLDYLNKKTPDLILMDVKMPQMNGLETCKKIKALSSAKEIPVIFISAHSTEQERLEGYKVGGSDYVGKPFNEEELLNKIKLFVSTRQNIKQLEDTSNHAFKTAMTSMMNAGELGEVITYFRQSFICKDVQALSRLALSSISSFQHEGCVYFNMPTQGYFNQSFYQSTDHVDEVLEKKIMDKAKVHGRIVEYGSRLIFNAGAVSLMIKNVDFNDDKVGRLKDHLAVIAEGLEERLESIQVSEYLEVKKRANSKAQLLAAETIEDIRTLFKNQRIKSMNIMSGITDQLEQSFFTLDLNERQEKHLSELLSEGETKMDTLYDAGTIMEDKLNAIVNELSEE